MKSLFIHIKRIWAFLDPDQPFISQQLSSPKSMLVCTYEPRSHRGKKQNQIFWKIIRSCKLINIASKNIFKSQHESEWGIKV